MRSRLLVLVLIVCAMWASPASAKWLRAASPHFIVYADSSEKDITAFTTRLERLDSALRYLRGMTKDEADSANPVTIYVTSNVAAVQRLYGRRGNTSDVYGFYQPSASGSVAFTPRRAGNGSEYDLKPEMVLYHEYAHHFLLGHTSVAVPPWFSEGYAEFVSTAKITPTSIRIGGPAMHRAYDLMLGDPMPVARLFAYGTKKPTGSETAALYARGWLLTHYVIFNKARSAQFQKYVELLNAGKPGVEAGREAFGDLKQLDRELGKYLMASSITVLDVPVAKLPSPSVTSRPLTPGEAAMIDLRMRSERGVDPAEAAAVYAAAAKIAPAYPDDATMQGWFAEMAYDAKQDTVADASADRALKADPKAGQALLYKARVLLRQARTSGDPGMVKAARGLIVRANHADPDNAEALLLNYESYQLPGQTPSRTAVAGLQRAFILVPQDPGLRWAIARQELLDGDVKQARGDLAPLAYDPHAGGENDAARLIAMLDAGMSGPDALAKVESAEKSDQVLSD